MLEAAQCTGNARYYSWAGWSPPAWRASPAPGAGSHTTPPPPARRRSGDDGHDDDSHVSCVTCHVSCVMCHVSCVMCHVSRVMCHVSCVMCDVSCVTCHVSCVTCHAVLQAGPGVRAGGALRADHAATLDPQAAQPGPRPGQLQVGSYNKKPINTFFPLPGRRSCRRVSRSRARRSSGRCSG